MFKVTYFIIVILVKLILINKLIKKYQIDLTGEKAEVLGPVVSYG